MNQLDVKGAGLKALDQPLIDTSTDAGKVFITLLGCVATTERSLILERTEEGRQNAKAKGVQFGRKPKLSSGKLEAALAEFKDSKSSAADVAKKHGISRASLYRLAALESKTESRN